MSTNKLIEAYLPSKIRDGIILLFLATVLFSPFFLEGKAFLAADTLFLHYPWKSYTPPNFSPHNPLITDPVNGLYAGMYNTYLKQGEIHLWNPFVLTGIPGSTGEPGAYFPLKIILHKLFAPGAALTIFLYLHVFLMGLFMYLYLLQVGAGRRGALFGAVAYMFNGCVMVWLEFELWVTAGAYLPLLLIFTEKFLGEKKFFYSLAAGLIFGFLLLNASFQLAVYIAVFLFFYLLFIVVRAFLRNDGIPQIVSLLVCFALTGVIGVLVGALEILPYIELASQSSRINRSFEFRQFFDTLAQVPWRYFITLFFPDYFGSPVLYADLIPRRPLQEYMNYNELALYGGVPTVFAFLGCIAARKNKFSRFYLVMVLFMVALITGTYVYYPFFKLVPGMNKMNPTRLIFLFSFAFAAAAGLGIDGFENMSPLRKKIFVAVSVFITAVVAFLFFFSSTPEIASWVNRETFDFWQGKQDYRMQLIRNLRGMQSPVMYKPMLLTLLAVVLSSLFVYSKGRKSGALFVLILALLSYDLISFGMNYNTTTDPGSIYPATPSIEFLQKQPGPFRVVQDTDHGLFVNALIPFGIEEIGGYRSVYPDRINKIMSYIAYRDDMFRGAIFDRWVQFGTNSTDFSSPFFDLLNVRYVLTAPNVNLNNAKYRLVFLEDMAIYENIQALPRAYLVHEAVVKHDMQEALRFLGSPDFDMRKQVVLEEQPPPEFTVQKSPLYPEKLTIERYTPEEIEMTADLSVEGWLVVSDAYYPGWTALVDGKETKIVAANWNFRAVPLQAGTHRIAFIYRPRMHSIGAIVTIAGILFTIAGMGALWLRSRPGGKQGLSVLK